MAQVDEAEKEASEVLHSLLSVERIEKTEPIVILETTGAGGSPSSYNNSNSNNGGNSNGAVNASGGASSDVGETEGQMQWQTPITLPAHSIFSSLDGSGQFQEQGGQVIWEGHAIQVDSEGSHIDTIYTTTAGESELVSDSRPKKTAQQGNKSKSAPQKASTNISGVVKKKPPLLPKKKKKKCVPIETSEPTKLEESSAQVKERFKRGCECLDESCFRGLNPDSVYKHRLNIAELTKGEHDMYLMGVTMACLANPETTVRHKERRRLRAQYVYQGRRVCLDAFLYLENCTHYQLKRIRKHVMTHGVAPRIHGNHGKKPHNTFPLDIYYHATEFLKQYLEQYTGERDIVNTKQPIQLPWDVTRKNLHDAYKEYGQILEPGIKLMGYSTFRHFMKEQFPHVKFCKIEPKVAQAQQSDNMQQSQGQQQQQQQQHTITKAQIIEQRTTTRDVVQKCVINAADVSQVIPLVVAQPDSSGNQHQQAFLVTPVSQIIPNGSGQSNSGGTSNSTTYSYQFGSAGYVINEQGIVTTMPNAQHHAPYTFSRM